MRVVLMLAALVLAPFFQSLASAQVREGVSVHGHWAIEIRNADGTLASRHEFQNALSFGGQVALAQSLARTASVAYWAVRFSGNAVDMCQGPFSRTDCRIVEAGSVVPNAGSGLNQTLTVVSEAAAVRLTGHFTAQFAGSFFAVASMVSMCGTVSGYPACGSNAGAPYQDFSFRALGSNIAVQAGQIVQVTVTFTFS